MKHFRIILALLMAAQSVFGQKPAFESPNTQAPKPTAAPIKIGSKLNVIDAPSYLPQSKSPKSIEKLPQKQEQGQLLNTQVMGPGSTGGGNIDGQFILGVIRTLPEALRAKGLHLFPEFKIADFEAAATGPILIGIEHPIFIDGEEKAAKFDRVNNKITFSPVKFDEVASLPDGFIRIQSILFHEVLGLMGLEKDKEYHISSRLLGIEVLTAIGARGTKNQVFPQDPDDPQVIYWKINENNSVTFVYCKNRDRLQTCHILGNRSYSLDEVALAVQKRYLEDLHRAEKEKIYSLIGLGGLVTMMLAFGFLAVPIGVPLTAFAFGSAIIYGSVFSVAIIDSHKSTLRFVNDRIDAIKQVTNAEGGPSKSKYFFNTKKDIDELLKSINDAQKPLHNQRLN